MTEHWFWWLLTAAVIVWYSTVTVYVAFKGVTDIKTMLRHLASHAPEAGKGGFPVEAPESIGRRPASDGTKADQRETDLPGGPE